MNEKPIYRTVIVVQPDEIDENLTVWAWLRALREARESCPKCRPGWSCMSHVNPQTRTEGVGGVDADLGLCTRCEHSEAGSPGRSTVKAGTRVTGNVCDACVEALGGDASRPVAWEEVTDVRCSTCAGEGAFDYRGSLETCGICWGVGYVPMEDV